MLTLCLAIFAACMIWAAVNDMLTMKIPNACVLVLTGTFLVALPFSDLGLAGLGDHAVVMLGTLVLCFCLFMFNALGAGDGKLIAVTALWLGPSTTLYFVVLFGLLGGLLSLVVLLLRGMLLPVWLETHPVIVRLNGKDRAVPYALAIGPAGLIALPDSPWAAYLPRLFG